MNNPFAFETEPFEVYPEFQDEFDTESEEEFGRSRRIPMRQTGIRARPPRPAPSSLRIPTRSSPVVRPRPIIARTSPRILMPWSPLPAVHEPSTNIQEPTGSEYIRWVQHSLNTSMGLQLPVDGMTRTDTRRAIGSFQEQHGLPITGIVDPQTEDALIAASGNQPPQTEGITTELGFVEELDNFEEEVQVSAPYEVTLTYHNPVRLHNENDLNNNLPKVKGLYFIYTGERALDKPWYIGKSATNIKGRFVDRFKVFRDFNFSNKCYEKCLESANVRVGWYKMTTEGSPSAIGLRSKGKWEKEWKPMGTKGKKEAALLRVLEMYFIKKYAPPGNSSDVQECAEFTDTGKITIKYPGMVPPVEVVTKENTFPCTGTARSAATTKRTTRRR